MTVSVSAQSEFELSLESSSMPVIESPVIGRGFYSPGAIFHAEYTNVVVKEKSEQVQKDVALPKDTREPITQEKKVVASLTAEELSQMEKQGLLKREKDSFLGDQYAVHSTEEAKKLLDEALFEIEEIREREGDSKTTSSKKETSQVSSLNPHSKVIRFYVNGEDILKTCRTIYISDVQTDGGFLVTGDRNYSSDGKDRTETFHLIFKASFDKKENTNYTAAAIVTQDSTNENSFLYQLANKNDLYAQRVGNFVAMRSDNPEFKIEFLVDLGEE